MTMSFMRKFSHLRYRRYRTSGRPFARLPDYGLALCALVCCLSVPAHARQAPSVAPPPAAESAPATPQASGTISGTLLDPSGAAVTGARISLTRSGAAPNPIPKDKPVAPDAISGPDGDFTFTNLAPGQFQLTITAAGFATQITSIVLHPEEALLVPPLTLAVATEITQVQVVVPREEVAEAEIKQQEKQRIFGVIPNFYVSYVPSAAPLTSKQKFELAWKSTIDPVNFVLVGAIAGAEQAQNNFSDYGQGAQGYAKRYGAAFADFATDTYIGGAILPSLLKQDPRYFYKGTGSTRSRILYAIAASVICKGDNGHWQADYSAIGGSLASGGISNLYYPAKDRGAALVFENTLIGIGEDAATNILQEFVIRKLTRNANNIQTTGPPAQAP